MRYCAVCDEAITAENDSGEHIISNAIGGRVKVKGILCFGCNCGAGQTWDAALAAQLNPLCLLFGITRERGVPPAQNFPTADGRLRRMRADGTSTLPEPVFKEEKTDAGISISVAARTMEEARRMLAGIKRKYPHADIDKIAENLKFQTKYDDTPVRMDLSIGGTLGGRSIVKSALCLAVQAGADPKTCNLARAYLKGDDSNRPFGFYYQTSIVLNRAPGVLFHCVAIRGDARTGLLVGYVEYFSTFRMVVLLSDRYAGPNIEHSYAVNPLNGEKLPLEFDLSLSRDEIEATFRYERMPDGAMAEALGSVMPLAMARSFDHEKSRVVGDAVRYALANSGIKLGEEIRPEHAETISRLAVERMIPFITHLSAMRKRQAGPTA